MTHHLRSTFPGSRHLGSAFVIAATIALTLAMLTWLGFDLSHFERATIGDQYDGLLESYTLYQATDNLLRRPLNLGYSLMFAGEPNSFALTTATYGPAIIMLPLSVVVGADSPIVFNVYFVLTFALTAWAVYLLIRYLIRPNQAIALFATLMITFSPVRLMEIHHIAELSLQFAFFSLYFLHRLLDTPKLRWGIGLGLSVWLVLITSGYVAVATGVMLLTIFLAALIRRNGQLSPAVIRALTVAAVLTVILALPFIIMRYSSLRFRAGQPYEQVQAFSASMASWIVGSSLLYHDTLDYHGPSSLFPGFVPIGLALIAIWLWRRREPPPGEKTSKMFTQRELIGLYIIIAVVGYLMTLGPELRVNDVSKPFAPSPYLLLMQLPGFSSLRAISRFIILPLIAMGILSASALRYFSMRWKQSFWVAFSLVTLFMVFELVPSVGEGSHRILNAVQIPVSQRRLQAVDHPTQQPIDLWLAQQPASIPIFYYPADGSATYQYYASLPIHKHPMLNGYGAGMAPDWYSYEDWSRFPSQDTMNVLLAHQVGLIVVHRDYLSASDLANFEARWSAFEQEWSALPEAQRFGDVSVYQVTAPASYGANPQQTIEQMTTIRQAILDGRCFEAAIQFEQARTRNKAFPMTPEEVSACGPILK